MAFDRLSRARAIATAVCLCVGAACATIPRIEAASDIHAFLVAVRDGDRAGFEAHIDRAALKTQLRARLIAEVSARGGEHQGLAGLAATLAAPVAGAAVDLLVRPDTFRAAALRAGYDPNKPIPSTLQLTPLVKPLGDGRVCVTERHAGPCAFDFTNEGGVWRLTGYEGPIDLKRFG